MLIKYGGGSGGIRKYLEDGKKHGRELGGRDIMDERIVLAGNLEITDRIIESMETAGQRYLHITLSFSERDLPTPTLDAILADYNVLLMAAYHPEEYDMYAEAHVARIKGYVDVTTGEQITRLDHIHIVIPQVNLVTGRSLNPIGLAEKNFKWLDAIQEHLNEKYGLVSPKDRPREDTGTADILQRSRLDNFKKGKIHTFKDTLKKQIVVRNINTPSSLEALARDCGVVKWVNVGTPHAYLAVKPHGETRYINLRDSEFRMEFLSLSKEEKLAHKIITIAPKVGIGKNTHDQRADLLIEWTQKRSREVKYLNSGGKLYKKYHLQSSSHQRETLAEVEQRFYQKPEFKEKKHGSNKGKASQDPDNHRFLHRQSDIEKIRAEQASRSIHSVRNLHQRGVDRDRQSGNAKKLLQGSVSDVMDRRRAGADHALQRDAAALSRSRVSANPATGRASDSVVNQMLRDQNEKIAQKAVAKLSDFQSLKARLDPVRLLATLSKSHGLVPSDYEMSTGRDGGGRIRHKESLQNHNVSDFMTKHMKLCWKEAEVYLRSVYQEQMNILTPPRPAATPSHDLWAAFTAQRRADAVDHARLQELQRNSERARRQSIKDSFYENKSSAKLRMDISAKERRAEIALLQMNKVQQETRLRDDIQRERAASKELRRVREQYCSWLVASVQHGNEAALVELRQQRSAPDMKTWLTDSMIVATDEGPGTGYLHRQQDLQYIVHENGDITYSRFGKALIQDHGKSVRMLDTAVDTIELGLRLAIQKYGNKLTLGGTTGFIEEAIRIAVDGEMGITFSDARHREYMEWYKQQRAKQKAIEANIHDRKHFSDAAHSPGLTPETHQRETLDAQTDIAIPTQVKARSPFPRPGR